MKLLRPALTLTGAIAAPAVADTCNVPAGWAKPTAHFAARRMPMSFALSVGPANRLTLLPSADVTPVVASAHKSKPNTLAGIAAIDVPRAGKLEIALSTPTYVDLVRDEKIIPSISHRRADPCTGIHKIVAFDVAPGRYVIQLSDAATASIVLQATLD
ncbi:hypothetical protein BH09PSE3_BH09PSE3_11820 [soil metagenome]